MDSALVVSKSNPSKSEPNREDGSSATASAVPILSRDSPELLKRLDWAIFLQYLRNQKPPITLAECSENHVLDFLRYLDQLGEDKVQVHYPVCPFFGHPNPVAPCDCPLRQAWSSLDARIGRLRSAYVEQGGRPGSNPFAAGAVRDYLSEVRESQAKARGITYKKKEGKWPTTVTDKTVVASKGQGGNAIGTCIGGNRISSAAQPTLTTAEIDEIEESIESNQLHRFLEKQRQRVLQGQPYPMMSAEGLTRKGIVLGKMGNLSMENELVIDNFQKVLPEHQNPYILMELNHAEKAKRELEQQESFDTKLANEEHEKGKSDPNWGDDPLATPAAVPRLSPASLDWYDSQKRRDWNTFLQYLGKQEPPITVARCNEYDVLDFLRYLDQFGNTKVHITGCPFFGHPNPPPPCACPLRQSWVNLEALIIRLTLAYEENGGRPESNPFEARFVSSYLSLVRECQAEAIGISYKRKEEKCPTTVTDNDVVASKGQGGNTTGTGTGCGGDGSGSAAQTPDLTKSRQESV